jgi:Glycosyltransferase sugar-binding region containing DXD motif
MRRIPPRVGYPSGDVPVSAQLPIVQYWHEQDPPAQIAELMRSFARLNPDRPYLLFNARSAERFIGRHFDERESAAFRACGLPAMQADYFRYCALLQLGGVWVDASFSCAGSMSPLLAGPGGGRLFRAYSSDALLMNSLMAFTEPRHPFLRLTIDLATELIHIRWEGKVIQVTGPFVITSIYRLNQLGSWDAFEAEAALLERREQVPNLARYARLICELIGDYERVEEACEGIRVFAAIRRRDWVSGAKKPLPHRQNGHWSEMGSHIYA